MLEEAVKALGGIFHIIFPPYSVPVRPLRRVRAYMPHFVPSSPTGDRYRCGRPFGQGPERHRGC